MPGVHDLFSRHAEIATMPGRDICNDDLSGVDILLTRSITRVDASLLKNTPVKFVGSATGGADHIDYSYLDSNNIPWSVAPGCNAASVADYVLSCAVRLQVDNRLPLSPKVGVIGVGHIGKQVVQRLSVLNAEIVLNDPLRAESESGFAQTELDQFSDCDLVCVHTPLVKQGAFPTYHLINDSFLKQLKPGCVLLNAARGAVVDFSALKKHGDHLVWCLDVWEGEPEIDLDVLNESYIATPHVAGYAVESKLRGTYMIYEAACRAFGWELPAPFSSGGEAVDFSNDTWRESVLDVYDPMVDTAHMLRALTESGVDVKKTFDRLRMEYPDRHELGVSL